MVRGRFLSVAALGFALAAFPAPEAVAAGPAGLSISVPTTAALGTANTGAGSISGSLGSVTVTTSASGLLVNGSWTATVVAGPFKTGGGTAAETIAATSVRYFSGPATATSGLSASLCAPGQLVSSTPIDTPKDAFSCGGFSILGGTSVTWRPTITIALPPSAVAGTYTGTITHSVA